MHTLFNLYSFTLSKAHNSAITWPCYVRSRSRARDCFGGSTDIVAVPNSPAVKMQKDKIRLQPNPYEKANYLSRISFHWVSDFMALGSKGQVQPQDMLDILETERSNKLFQTLDHRWRQELSRWVNVRVMAGNGYTPSGSSLDVW